MPASRLINQVIGPYHLVESLARGGVSDVFRATHVDDGRPAAVKVMRADQSGDRQQVKAFEAEFDLLRWLDHPSLPAGLRAGRIQDRPAMVMAYFPGLPLHRRCAEQRPFDRVGCFLALVGVVAYLHRNGVIHNDLKLENVILRDDGRLGLVDFGNAQQQRGGALWRRLFRSRAVFGTASYIAPELAQGGRASGASDCYALGVCAHMLLIGRGLFSGRQAAVRVKRAVEEIPPRICHRIDALPPSLGAVIDACVAKDPAARPADAGELRRRLQAVFAARDVPTAAEISRRIADAPGDG